MKSDEEDVYEAQGEAIGLLELGLSNGSGWIDPFNKWVNFVSAVKIAYICSELKNNKFSR